jgi:hypothetical protein
MIETCFNEGSIPEPANPIQNLPLAVYTEQPVPMMRAPNPKSFLPLHSLIPGSLPEMHRRPHCFIPLFGTYKVDENHIKYV